jgi:hypothetical protein
MTVTTLLSHDLLAGPNHVPGAVVLRKIDDSPQPYATHIRSDRNPLEPVFTDGGYFDDLREAHADWLDRVRFESLRHIGPLLPSRDPEATTPDQATNAERIADKLSAIYYGRDPNPLFTDLINGLAILADRLRLSTGNQQIADGWATASSRLHHLADRIFRNDGER